MCMDFIERLSDFCRCHHTSRKEIICIGISFAGIQASEFIPTQQRVPRLLAQTRTIDPAFVNSCIELVVKREFKLYLKKPIVKRVVFAMFA